MSEPELLFSFQMPRCALFYDNTLWGAVRCTVAAAPDFAELRRDRRSAPRMRRTRTLELLLHAQFNTGAMPWRWLLGESGQLTRDFADAPAELVLVEYGCVDPQGYRFPRTYLEKLMRKEAVSGSHEKDMITADFTVEDNGSGIFLERCAVTQYPLPAQIYGDFAENISEWEVRLTEFFAEAWRSGAWGGAAPAAGRFELSEDTTLAFALFALKISGLEEPGSEIRFCLTGRAAAQERETLNQILQQAGKQLREFPDWSGEALTVAADEIELAGLEPERNGKLLLQGKLYFSLFF